MGRKLEPSPVRFRGPMMDPVPRWSPANLFTLNIIYFILGRALCQHVLGKENSASVASMSLREEKRAWQPQKKALLNLKTKRSSFELLIRRVFHPHEQTLRRHFVVLVLSCRICSFYQVVLFCHNLQLRQLDKRVLVSTILTLGHSSQTKFFETSNKRHATR